MHGNKCLEIHGAYTNCCTELKLPNGCSNGNVSLFKVMLQWLANYSIKDSSF